MECTAATDIDGTLASRATMLHNIAAMPTKCPVITLYFVQHLGTTTLTLK
jgi:hypothetical protein